MLSSVCVCARACVCVRVCMNVYRYRYRYMYVSSILGRRGCIIVSCERERYERIWTRTWSGIKFITLFRDTSCHRPPLSLSLSLRSRARSQYLCGASVLGRLFCQIYMYLYVSVCIYMYLYVYISLCLSSCKHTSRIRIYITLHTLHMKKRSEQERQSLLRLICIYACMHACIDACHHVNAENMDLV